MGGHIIFVFAVMAFALPAQAQSTDAPAPPLRIVPGVIGQPAALPTQPTASGRASRPQLLIEPGQTRTESLSASPSTAQIRVLGAS